MLSDVFKNCVIIIPFFNNEKPTATGLNYRSASAYIPKPKMASQDYTHTNKEEESKPSTSSSSAGAAAPSATRRERARPRLVLGVDVGTLQPDREDRSSRVVKHTVFELEISIGGHEARSNLTRLRRFHHASSTT